MKGLVHRPLSFLKSLGLASLVTALTSIPSLAVEKLSVPLAQAPLPATSQLEQAEVYNQQGVELSQKGQYAQAIEAFKKAIELYPNSEHLHSNLGIAFGNQGQFEEAIESFRQALSINPNNWETYNNLGIALGGQEKYSEAVGAFNEAIQKNPQASISYLNLSVAYWRQQQLPEAIAALEKARELFIAQNQKLEVKRIDEILPRMRQLLESSGGKVVEKFDLYWFF